jgi:hypothetical protein
VSKEHAPLIKALMLALMSHVGRRVAVALWGSAKVDVGVAEMTRRLFVSV